MMNRARGALGLSGQWNMRVLILLKCYLDSPQYGMIVSNLYRRTFCYLLSINIFVNKSPSRALNIINKTPFEMGIYKNTICIYLKKF